MNILLIEDDVVIASQIKKDFASWNYTVETPTDFHEVLKDFEAIEPQLVMIDIQLPAFDGFHWCRQIRAISTVPILFLSSRDQPLDMVMAMQMGADDYVQKPFHMDVLRSKVQALLRRTYDYQEVKEANNQFHDAQVDYAASTISKGEQVIELTKNEQFILKVLLESPDEIVSRDDLMKRLWDDARFVNDNTLTVNVNRLRGKLEELGLVDVIVTKKGLGYMAVTHHD
ncbi:PhoB family transcriptional regulator [Kurthia sp. 3B1D]|uniref:PhoB family transcriptional regulator n=2 Tax=Kurthia TaxID=1649 RepID=A0A433RQN1_9BACL|nr:response regulator transcription factor [Kurthia sp. 3B1D]RUS53020.1 PhoB family transcriptional regulator [Kurthia sp. 3B1D]